ncbi:hypothetical protein SDC9_46827 [bioreactor metagenome]|uniref:Uncharacterized protein n=1 Tax=bioreactor metagenome TaxID=1076179 RepID=A0A644W9Y2_9ZZZZ
MKKYKRQSEIMSDATRLIDFQFRASEYVIAFYDSSGCYDEFRTTDEVEVFNFYIKSIKSCSRNEYIKLYAIIDN